MPGFNGMGPQGVGPMTGRGRGYCIVNIDSCANIIPGSGKDWGRGRRNCFYATGLPWWARFAPGAAPGGAALTFLLSVERELDLLKEQAVRMESALEQTKRKIEELGDRK